MDLGFIRRAIWSALGITGLVFLVLLAYGKSDWAWAVGLGSLWACGNWVLITALVKLLVTGERVLTGRVKVKIAILALVKFPLLYGAGYLLLRLGLPVLGLLTGFWIVLAVVVAKAIGRLITRMDAVPLAGRVEGSEGKST